MQNIQRRIGGNVAILPSQPISNPDRHLIDALRRVYAAMPVSMRDQSADVYLDMITAGVRAARKAGNDGR